MERANFFEYRWGFPLFSNTFISVAAASSVSRMTDVLAIRLFVLNGLHK